MSADRLRRLEELYHAAVARSVETRAAFLDQACPDDVALRDEVLSLLAHAPSAADFLERPAVNAAAESGTMEIAAGTRFGPYEILTPIGAGGMGEVYRARDTRLGRTVALKILPPHLRSNPQLLARFEREARTIAGLNHPYICTLHDVGRHDDIDFLVMEFVEGEMLSSRLLRGRLPIEEAARFAREVAEALAAAHGKGIIHRDIKPSNIIVSSGGHVKVVDFGLARASLFDGAETTPGPTEPGVRVGTPHYMSPEQALGQRLDPRTDLFSLGVVLFECLTGELPFDGATRFEYLQNLLSGQVKSIAELRADVPASLRAILARCMERDASKRLNSAAWLAVELDGIERGARSPMPWRLARWTIGVAVLAAAVAMVVLSSGLWLKPPPPSAGADVPQLRRFTTSAGEESDSHFSPDGMWVSFIAMEGSTRRLFAQQVDGGERRPVTLPAGSLQSHVWSSDGTKYACLIRQDPGWTVQIVPTYFGSSVPEQTVPVPPIPRTAKLLRWIDRAIYVQVEEAGRSPSLQRLDLSSNKFERLTGPWRDMSVRGFDVRPDGRQVVWSAVAESKRDDLWVAELDGGSATQLTRTDDESRKRFPLWNGLGTTVIYQSTRGGQVDLWELDLNSRQSLRLTSDPGIERPESTSKNGSLSYQMTSQKAALWIWNAREGRGTQVSDEGLSDFAPSTSRDGPLQVAFQRSLASPVEGFLQMDTDIFIGDVTDSGTRLTNARKVGTGLVPQLSPDAKRLAYLQREPETSATAKLVVRNVATSALETVSSAVPLPSVNNFPADWREQNLAWTSSGDLYFVAREGPPEVSRLVRYRVGDAPRPLPATESTSRLTDIYPSSDGKTIAYVTWTPAKEPDKLVYQVHALDLTTGAHRVVRDLGSHGVVRLRGWLRNDVGLVIAKSLSLDADQTWTFELLILSPDGSVRQTGTIDHVVSVSRLMSRQSDLYFTRSLEGVGNLLAYSFTARKPRQVSENLVRDVTFGSVAPLGGEHVVGIRHELTRDIHLLDARPQVRRNLRTQ